MPDPHDIGLEESDLGNVGLPFNLTPKMEAFAQHYITYGVYGHAYRFAYDCHPDTKNATCNRHGWELARHPRVSARIRQLQRENADAHKAERERIALQYRQERNMAMELLQPQHATKASQAEAQLYGLNEKQVVEVQNVNLPPLSPEELKALADAEDDDL